MSIDVRHDATLERMLRASPVMPILALDRLDQALPLIGALLEGGLSTFQLSLRSPMALDAIRLICRTFPGAYVGAGNVTTPETLRQAVEAGAGFAASPGLSPTLLTAAQDCPIPLLPGVMTPTEVMAAVDAGFTCLALFPARYAGGADLLKALATSFGGVRFCATGGVTMESAPALLAQPNVICVGGSWLTPKASLDAGDWKGIMELARQASSLAH